MHEACHVVLYNSINFEFNTLNAFMEFSASLRASCIAGKCVPVNSLTIIQ